MPTTVSKWRCLTELPVLIRLFWIAVFCLAALQVIPGIYEAISGKWNRGNGCPVWLYVLIQTISIIGVFGFAFRRRLGTQSLWKLFFVASIVYIVWDLYSWLSATPKWARTSSEYGDMTLIAPILITLVYLLAHLSVYIPLFLYGFRSKDLWAGETSDASKISVDTVFQKFWIFYFWLSVTLLIAIALIALYGEGNDAVSRLDWMFYSIEAVFATVGLYGLAFNRRIGRQLFWKVACVACIFHGIGSSIQDLYSASMERNAAPILVYLVMALLFQVPHYIGLYLYGFRREELWSRPPRSSST